MIDNTFYSVFLRNEYTERYKLLIEKGKNRNQIPENSEVHHIIPKFCGGNNSRENLVCLSLEEHFEAHQLLTEMFISPKYKGKAYYSLWIMSTSKDSNGNIKHITSPKEYSELKKVISKIVSDNPPCKYITEETWKIIGDKNRQRLKGKKPANYGSKFSDDDRKIISEKTKISMKKEEIKQKMKIPKSEDHKKSLKLAASKRIPIHCIHCEKNYPPANYVRWHGEKCKNAKYIGRK